MESTAKRDSCVLCCQDIDMFAVGKCDHPVCYRCSTKMRLLCEQKYCAVCREQLDKVPQRAQASAASHTQTETERDIETEQPGDSTSRLNTFKL